jgi:hypothetical protein
MPGGGVAFTRWVLLRYRGDRREPPPDLSARRNLFDSQRFRATQRGPGSRAVSLPSNNRRDSLCFTICARLVAVQDTILSSFLGVHRQAPGVDRGIAGHAAVLRW